MDHGLLQHFPDACLLEIVCALDWRLQCSSALSIDGETNSRAKRFRIVLVLGQPIMKGLLAVLIIQVQLGP